MCRLLNINVIHCSNTCLCFRGYKVVVKFFPNEAANLEPVVELLLKIEKEVCPSLTALHCIALHCIALHCIALHCIALHCIALHCIAWHCILSIPGRCPCDLPHYQQSCSRQLFNNKLHGVPKHNSCNRTPEQS